MSKIAAALGGICFFTLLLAVAIWSALALYVQLAGWQRALALAAVGAVVLALVALRGHAPLWAWGGFGCAALLVGIWYGQITPRDDRDWAMDVARGVKAERDGTLLRLSDVRDFVWTSETEAEERWITQDFDLERLTSVDMITSTWSSPHIAHLLVSFGFDDGRHIAFSAEIRRERGEKFSELGGFFRQFELVLIAATEADIVQLRTTHRREDVRLYPVLLPAEQRKALLLSFVDLAQSLEGKPRFYNTVTANCTTAVYTLASQLAGGLPLDWRVLASGHIADYVADLGYLAPSASPATRDEAARISAWAREWAEGEDFSAHIRAKPLSRP